MHVLVIASRKRGSGKTMFAGHLAVEAERRGAGPVVVIDTDPRGALANWWNLREFSTPRFANTSLHKLSICIDYLADAGFELLIIDTPPAIPGLIRQVAAVADLVLIATRSSPRDLDSAADTASLVEESGKPLVFVVNGAAPRSRITDEAVVTISQHGPLAPVIIHQLGDFRSGMIDGLTAAELSENSSAATEMARLWDYLAKRLSLRTSRKRGRAKFGDAA